VAIQVSAKGANKFHIGNSWVFFGCEKIKFK